MTHSGILMSGKIFLSYRREDGPGFALALFGRLEQSFPTDQLFMDVEGGIKAGEDFVRALEEQVDECDVMLVLIGPNWLTITDEMGRRRLDNPEDFVRIEVESALRLGKRVIPVLVHKTEMPRADALPELLKPLARRNAVGLTHERFKSDAQGLIKALESALAEVKATRERAPAEAVAAEEQPAAERKAKAEETARTEKERVRLHAIAGLSPDQIAKAEELANWDFIKTSGNSQDFRDHLARFPNGVTERMARTKLEALVWVGLAVPIDVPALQSFLEEFPNGAHGTEAKSKLAELEHQAAAAREAEEHHRRETDAWASASATGTVAALESFLNDWPQSQHSNAARKLIKEIEVEPTRRWVTLGLGALVGLVIVVSAISVQLRPGFLLWRLAHDQSTRTFSDSGYSVAFAPDGRTALSGSRSRDNTFKLWDVATGREIRTFTGHSHWVVSVAFAPDGHTALSGGWDNTLKLWDVATGREIRTFRGHSRSVDSVAFAPDGHTALSGDSEGTVKLWDVATGREIRTFTGHSNSVVSVAFAPDGRTALAAAAPPSSVIKSRRLTRPPRRRELGVVATRRARAPWRS
jgi:chemotaxis response regulator CheB